MILRLLPLLACVLLVACVSPQASYVHVSKSKREMVLLTPELKVIKKYNIALGFDPIGHKFQEGDGKTPEGLYKIDYKNPRSRFHRSLHISYPNATDYAVAREQGYQPGGNIVIHGIGNAERVKYYKDWTWGCIAVKDREIDQIFAMVPPGTPILIEP